MVKSFLSAMATFNAVLILIHSLLSCLRLHRGGALAPKVPPPNVFVYYYIQVLPEMNSSVEDTIIIIIA